MAVKDIPTSLLIAQLLQTADPTRITLHHITSSSKAPVTVAEHPNMVRPSTNPVLLKATRLPIATISEMPLGSQAAVTVSQVKVEARHHLTIPMIASMV